MRIRPVNASTVLVELADLDAVLALQASLTLDPLPGIEETLPAAQTVMLRVDPSRLTREGLAQALAARDLSGLRRASGPSVDIPVRYDGEDLAEVSRLSGLAVDEVIRRHQAGDYTVAFCGFAPGFAYLVGGDPALQVPRRATPRTQVPAGAVALGGPYCGVYPRSTPGGWQIIGTTSLTMWDAGCDPPARLLPGMRVRFVEVGAHADPRWSTAPPVTERPSGKGAAPYDALLTVIHTMLPALVQDLGRPGHAQSGVAPSGAMDHGALQAANRAVGNPPGAAALEITLGELTFGCSDAVLVAIAGAPVPITVQRAGGETVEAVARRPLALGRGDRVTLGRPTGGVRSYLAVRGGFEVPRALGSAARDTLAALGPEPVVKGTVLAVGRGFAPAPSLRASSASADTAPPLPMPGDVVELEVSLGPRDDRFTDASLALLTRQSWRVTPQSSRVGLRLAGERPLERRDAAELPSEGLVRGAIQVPHDGQPVLLLADHPLTGGYPVIAVVAEHHLDLAGQLPPGTCIRFRAASSRP